MDEEIHKRLGEMQSHDDVQGTFERTRQHLIEFGVDLAATPLTLGRLLRFDGTAETVLDDEAANALLTREYRAPFVLPSEHGI